ncbi:MAG: TIGR02147 family protein [Fibrobacter sp.]|nr:TIGR02147 family protein [Fibrobacter sp.]
MKSIVEYQDYRSFMRDFYEERKRSSAFTWREFAKLAGFASSGYLKLVCDGKTRLSQVGAEKVAVAMELTGFQIEYFCRMVEFCDGTTDVQKQKAFVRMQKLAADNKVRILGGEFYSYFSNWINPALRELAPIMPGAKPIDMARVLCPSVPAADVRYSLDLMIQMGLLKKTVNKKGEIVYQQEDSGLNPEFNPDQKAALNVAMRALQKKYARIASDSLEEFPPSERHLSGKTVGLDRKAYERIVAEIADFHKRIENILLDVKEYDRVYRLSMQLFPLSRDLKGKDDGND